MSRAETTWINGPVIKARAHKPFAMKESVSVGPAALAGEVIRLDRQAVTIQVFEDTTGLNPGAVVTGHGTPLAAELGPGLLGKMFDGIQRPLDTLAATMGDYIQTGATVPALSRDASWSYRPCVPAGTAITPGQILGDVPEGKALVHRILAPPGVAGMLEWMADPGPYRVTDCIARIRTAGEPVCVTMMHHWPIRSPRPVAKRLSPSQPLVTGQRVIDTFYPVAKGGTAVMPGGFGTGKTVLLQTLAKWCDAEVIIYIGCGERGNEMAGVLAEFPDLEDPRTGRRLMERTVLIANTSNMPVAAREASIYTGITIGEYFRDQGYDVALFADSISRWAEALREISGRLEELPAEEGYPAYLPARLAEFFERAGGVAPLSGQESSLTAVATVSPPGGDFSEPVTAHSRRFVKSFLALDRERAQGRFYPAIHPLLSYSDYVPDTARWWQGHGGFRWSERRERMMTLLQEQSRLEQMAKIVGRDALAPDQRLILVCTEVMVEALLRQSAYSEIDRYCGPEKQIAMLELVDTFIARARQAVKAGLEPDTMLTWPIVRRLRRVGEDVPNDGLELLGEIRDGLENAFSGAARDTDS